MVVQEADEVVLFISWDENELWSVEDRECVDRRNSMRLKTKLGPRCALLLRLRGG